MEVYDSCSRRSSSSRSNGRQAVGAAAAPADMNTNTDSGRHAAAVGSQPVSGICELQSSSRPASVSAKQRGYHCMGSSWQKRRARFCFLTAGFCLIYGLGFAVWDTAAEGIRMVASSKPEGRRMDRSRVHHVLLVLQASVHDEVGHMNGVVKGRRMCMGKSMSACLKRAH